MGYAPARSSVWAKDGMKDRARSMKNKILGKEERELGEAEALPRTGWFLISDLILTL